MAAETREAGRRGEGRRVREHADNERGLAPTRAKKVHGTDRLPWHAAFDNYSNYLREGDPFGNRLESRLTPSLPRSFQPIHGSSPLEERLPRRSPNFDNFR